MIMQEDEYSGPGLMYVEGGVLVGMRRPRLERTHALYGPCVCRTGSCPPACGRRIRAELHIQDIGPRMLQPFAAPRRGASCTHPCCSFPSLALFAHIVQCWWRRRGGLNEERDRGVLASLVGRRSGIATAPQKGKPLCVGFSFSLGHALVFTTANFYPYPLHLVEAFYPWERLN